MLPRLHVVTDDAILARTDFESIARKAVEVLGSEIALHLRGRAAHGRRLFSLASALEPVARESGALIVINDRIDIALAAGVRAVQLSERSLPLDVACRIAGPDRLVGWSAHSAADVERARANRASFALLGTIWPSASHPGGPAGGTNLLRSACARAWPVLAIGGVTQERVGDAIAAGAYGVAVISAVWGSADPVRSAQDLVRELRIHVDDK